MKNARKPLAGLIALGAALALPVAFAQDATTQDPTATHDATTHQQTAPTPQTTPEAAAQPLTWADVDSDSDGKLSKEEAARVPTLAQAFDDADADNDGLLTQEEYQAYVAQNDASTPPTDGGGND
jgi:predicted outer membrane protein